MGQLDGGEADAAAGLTPWGDSPAYALKNLHTGMYLAAHKDGELVAEDDTTSHHDLVWKIYTTASGSVALQSCHGTFLQVGPDGTPNCNGTAPGAPASAWGLQGHGHGHTLHSAAAGTWLAAVPPVEGQQAVFLRPHGNSPAEHWHVEPISAGTALLSRVEGAVF